MPNLIFAQDPERFRLELWLFSLFPAGRRGRCWAELPASRREGRRRTDGPLGVGDHVSDLTLGWIQTSFRTQVLRLQRVHLGTQHISGGKVAFTLVKAGELGESGEFGEEEAGRLRDRGSQQRQCSGFEIQSGKDLSAKTPVAITSVNTQGLRGGGGPPARAKTCTTPYFALAALSSLPQKLQASPLPSRKATRSCICRRISLASSPPRAERPCAAHRASPALGGGRSAPAADWRAARPGLASPF